MWCLYITAVVGLNIFVLVFFLNEEFTKCVMLSVLQCLALKISNGDKLIVTFSDMSSYFYVYFFHFNDNPSKYSFTIKATNLTAVWIKQSRFYQQ